MVSTESKLPPPGDPGGLPTAVCAGLWANLCKRLELVLFVIVSAGLCFLAIQVMWVADRTQVMRTRSKHKKSHVRMHVSPSLESAAATGSSPRDRGECPEPGYGSEHSGTDCNSTDSGAAVKVEVNQHILQGRRPHSRGLDDMFECPSSFVVSRDTLAAMKKYNDLTREASYDPGSSPLHFYSLYGATTLEQWDAIVRAHVARIGYKRGERIFEAGTAAGAFVDSLSRQYGVLVGGVDVAQDAIAIAQSRINGTFCAANSDHVPFVESASFDHAVSFAVLMYVDDVSAACKVASELVRIVKPGGTVFLGQINDPDMRVFASGRAEGMWGVSMLFWHRFAYLGGHEVVVIKAEDVYSKRVFPLLDHYDLHAPLRYNVYIKKGMGKFSSGNEGDVCRSIRSDDPPVSRKTVAGKQCSFPFSICTGECIGPGSKSGPAILFDDCTTVGDVQNREWCSITSVPAQSMASKRVNGSWDYCKPRLRAATTSKSIFGQEKSPGSRASPRQNK